MSVTVDSQMVLAIGAVTEGGGPPPGPLTFAFTNVAGTYLLVACATGRRGSLNGAAPPHFSSVTYAGTGMTLIAEITTDGDRDGIAIYGLLSPATGINNVVVTLSGGGSWDANSTIIAGALSVTGNDTSTPLVSSQTATAKDETGATSDSLATPGATASGNLVVWAEACGAAISSVNKTETWRKNQNTSSTAGNASMQYAAGTGSALTGTFNHGNDWSQIIVVEIAAASGASPQTINAAVVTSSWVVPAPAVLTPKSIAVSAVVSAWTVPGPTVTPGVAAIAAAAVVSTWTVPAPAVVTGGGPQTVIADPVIASWIVPAPVVLSPITLSPAAVAFTWTVPAAAIVPGPAIITATPAISVWVVPAVLVNGLAGDTAEAFQPWGRHRPVRY